MAENTAAPETTTVVEEKKPGKIRTFLNKHPRATKAVGLLFVGAVAGGAAVHVTKSKTSGLSETPELEQYEYYATDAPIVES